MSEQAYKTLDFHKDVFDFQERNKEIPDRSNQAVVNIVNAYKDINPSVFIDWACSGCIYDIVKKAGEALKTYNESKAVKFTFPKQ